MGHRRQTQILGQGQDEGPKGIAHQTLNTAVPSLSTGVLTVWGKELGHRRQTQIPGQGQDEGPKGIAHQTLNTAVLSLSTGVLTVWGKEVGHRRQTQIPGQGQDALASIAELVVKKSENFLLVLSVDNQRSIKLCQKKL